MNKLVKKEDLLILDKKILLLTGSFDLLHDGHRYLFSQARQRVPSDTELVVIILSDENIRKRKGKSRPIQNETTRINTLAGIDIVDRIVLWEEDWKNLREFVLMLKPAFMALVEGDPGFESKYRAIKSYGGEVILIDRLSDISTTKIIKEREKL